jgi:histidinol phosphatase-like PHP family hydrolase
MLRGALHTHTTCSDGTLSPAEVLRVYRDLDFDFVALTDHDFLMKPNAYEGIPSQFQGMLVFRGIEKTVFCRGYVHVNQIFGDKEVLRFLNHPAEYGFTVPQINTLIDDIGRSLPIHAVEVSMKGFYTPEYDVAEIALPKVASDDSHTPEGCGRAWVEVDCDKDADTILRAIKGGQARIRCKGTAHQSGWAVRGGTSGG